MKQIIKERWWGLPGGSEDKESTYSAGDWI